MRKPGPGICQLFAGIAACAGWSAGESLAQSYPVKPIHLAVGFPAGSGADFVARIAAKKLSEHLGQNVVVENRTGAGGTIATERVALSPADGYTLLMMTAAETAQPALRANLRYSLERDLAPVSLLATGTFVLVVHPSVPARNVRELIALARLQPGKLNYASSGIGSSPHLAAGLLNRMAKVNIVQVQYRGATETVTATAAGEVDISFPSITAVLPLLEGGRLRPLAVTSAKRASLLPSLPTVDESGLPGYERSTWHGVLTPAGVPKDIIARLNAVIVKSVNTPEVKRSFDGQGLELQTNTAEEFAALIRNSVVRNTQLIKTTGAKAE